jgi:hypothetical protein
VVDTAELGDNVSVRHIHDFPSEKTKDFDGVVNDWI